MTARSTSVSRTLTRAQSRRVDEVAIHDFGMPGVVLMENAGRNCAELLQSRGWHGRVLICCGKGNNGGDGYVMARHLRNAGIEVAVWLTANPVEISGDAAVNLQILSQFAPPRSLLTAAAWSAAVDEMANFDLLVDALLGTGATGDPREPVATAIQAMHRSGRPVFAVDVPSGLDCDTGQPGTPCIQATLTATFVAPKVGFHAESAQRYLGEVQVIDIGIPREVLDRI